MTQKKTAYRRLNTTFGVLRSDFGAQTPHHVFGCLGTSNWTPWNPRLILGSLEIPLIPNLYHWFRAPSLPVFFGRESSLPFIQPFLVGGWITQLKNMRKSNWIISPAVGVKKNIWNHHLQGVDSPFKRGKKRLLPEKLRNLTAKTKRFLRYLSRSVSPHPMTATSILGCSWNCSIFPWCHSCIRVQKIIGKPCRRISIQGVHWWFFVSKNKRSYNLKKEATKKIMVSSQCPTWFFPAPEKFNLDIWLLKPLCFESISAHRMSDYPHV